MNVFKRRQEALFERLSPDVDVALLTPGPSLLYLTGYDFNRVAWGEDSPFLFALTRDLEGAALLPSLEVERAGDLLDAEFYRYSDDGDSPREAVERLASEYALSPPIAVEYSTMRLQEFTLLEAVTDTRDVVDLAADVAVLRARKDGRELELFRRAAEITDEILTDALRDVEPGMREEELERELRVAALDSEADGYGSGVVTSGPRTAINYTETTSREIGADELVLVDTGVVYKGYYTDITRTVAVGDPDERLVRAHEIVRDAARTAREGIESGVTAHEADALARDVIDGAGFGDEFVHALGHGIGLDSHEAPMLERGNHRTLEPGNVFTVEPGIYIDDVGGVRIEDNVAITPQGTEVLSDAPRSLFLDS